LNPEGIGLLLGSSATGGGLVAAVAYFLFQRLIERMDRVETELATVRDKRLAAVEAHVADDRAEVVEARLQQVERQVSGHLEKDESQRITAELKILTGEVRRMTDRMDAVLAQSEGQRAELAATKSWLRDVAGDLDRHRENQGIHGGK